VEKHQNNKHQTKHTGYLNRLITGNNRYKINTLIIRQKTINDYKQMTILKRGLSVMSTTLCTKNSHSLKTYKIREYL